MAGGKLKDQEAGATQEATGQPGSPELTVLSEVAATDPLDGIGID